jgi:hypothetical protein
MARHGRTTVKILIILWDKVDIVENEAREIMPLDGLGVSNVKKHGTVERVSPCRKTGKS